MRLSDILSKPPKANYLPVDGFLVGKKGNIGQKVDLSICTVALNYYCDTCDDLRTFYSQGNLSCIFIDKRMISIDCVLSCGCGATVEVWFLVECEGDITSQTPKIRVLKRSEKLSEKVKINNTQYGDFDPLLEKADRAFRDALGAGAIVYLRKILERVTAQTAKASGISTTIITKKGEEKRKTFRDLLTEVDGKCSIIPKEFSANGYTLFSELSEIVHSNGDDEEQALKKYDALHRLVIGVLDNVKNNSELMAAIGELGWNAEEGEET